MSKNKSLLNENTIRRMMKLASVDALSDTFISTKYTSLTAKTVQEGTKKGEDNKEGNKAYVANKDQDEVEGGHRTGEEAFTTKKGMKKKTGPGVAYQEGLNEDEEEERELDATEDELSDMDSEADRERDELDADEEVMEDEVTLTDAEAQEIIALADKLRAAMGGAEEPEPEVEMDMDMSADMGGEEMEMDAEVEEEPGMRYDMKEEKDDLFEAALSGLNIELVDDKQIQLENLKKAVYQKVVSRLLKETKK